VRDTPIAVLHVESAILPLHERWRLLVSRRALRLQYYISPTSPLAGLKPSGPRKKYSPIHCIQQLLEHDVQDPTPPIEDRRKPPWEEQQVDVEGAKWLRQYADKQILLLKKAEERWQEQYDNDPTGACFRQMEPKMVCTTSVTKLCLKWTLRDAPRRILSKIVQYRSGRDLVKAWRQRSASQEERTRRNLTVPVSFSKLSSIFSRNVFCPKHAGTFLERFLQHWRNESCWGPREASRL
jgi:hypothetical protein